MDDTLSCPICGAKTRNIKQVGSLFYTIGKRANYTERLCTGTNHLIQYYVDEDTGKVDYVRISLDAKYSKFLEIDFHNVRCQISCFKNGSPEIIKIEKMIEPDFPNLTKLKEKVSLYITFS